MFTKNDLIELVQQFPFDETQFNFPEGWYYSGITQCLKYSSYGFYCPTEQYIRITRADKHIQQQFPGRYPNKNLLFWINSETYEGFFMPMKELYRDHLINALFEPLNVQAWEELVADWCSDLKSPPALPLNPTDTFIRGILLHDFRTDLCISAVAEYQNELIHFLWETGA